MKDLKTKYEEKCKTKLKEISSALYNYRDLKNNSEGTIAVQMRANIQTLLMIQKDIEQLRRDANCNEHHKK
jgi:hypothetical protein